MAKTVLINPNLMVQKNDLFTLAAVLMPVGLAYFAGSLKQKGIDFSVVDAFGESPNQLWQDEEFYYRGLTPKEVVDKLEEETEIVVLNAMTLWSHRSLIKISQEIRNRFPRAFIVVIENTQAVTAYSLRHVQKEFFEAGVNYVVTGESEIRTTNLISMLLKGEIAKAKEIDGVGSEDGHYTPPASPIKNLDVLAFAAWERFPVKNYWKLRYSHGPSESGTYFPLLTSRGCPYTCRFCVIPETNDIKWRAKSASNVVDEMIYLKEKFGVTEFHLEDVNPTVSDKRTRKICHEIIKRNLKISWKLVSGTKVETLKDEETIELMAKAGCKYISLSPESGSPRVLELMDKSFDSDHAVKLIRKMNDCGIHSQCCFVLGFPGETGEDRLLTEKMVHNLTKAGVDEVAFFVATPVPGSKIFDGFENRPSEYSKLNFSPAWRKDYQELNRFRLRLYRSFLKWKLLYHPLKTLRQPVNFLRRKYNTKMEMIPYRALHTFLLSKGIRI